MIFQAYVVICAVIIMVILVIVIRRTMSKQKNNVNWPLYVQQCPDYWVDYTGNGSKCVSNGYNVSKACNGTIDFSGNYCTKLSKIQKCGPGLGVLWDGVTYGTGNNKVRNKCI